MKKIIVICILFSNIVACQKKDEILLKIDGNPVYKSEFIELFGKYKNSALVKEKQSFEKDFKLFVDYKLKLIEANELGLDTVTSYKQEISKYRNQLVIPYLNDKNLMDSLSRQAYNRSLKEIKASHILVKLEKDVTDTIESYNKILDLRNKIIGGFDFSELAKEYSEDPSAKSNKGDLGYFSVFKMVSSFEDMAYNTPVGEISEIFRSRFGYHILKVEDVRPSVGEVEVAHIMVRDTTAKGKIKIDTVYNKILEGSIFEELAKKYSDDKRSLRRGGRLTKFTKGALPEPFGEISFSLSKENIYSKPFKTDYGWHVVKFIKHHPIQDFESSKNHLLKKIKRYKSLRNTEKPIIKRLKKEYTIVINEKIRNSLKNNKKTDSLYSKNEWLLVIQKDTLRKKDFDNYCAIRKNRKPSDLFDNFVNEEILVYYKEHLEETNQEFRKLFEEYKRGMLLFDLMKLKIWDKAQKDSIGLQKFYEINKEKYKKQPTSLAAALNEDTIQNLDDIRGRVINDYQDYIENRWIEELRKKHHVKTYKRRLRKLKKEMNFYDD